MKGVTLDDVRQIAIELPRTTEHLMRGDVTKFKVKQLVYAAVGPDETVMGVAFPKLEREAMVDAEPWKFAMPSKGDLRYNWIHLSMAEVDEDELRELVIEGWRMCVPKFISAMVP
jgi:hypothetical protein